MPQDTIDLSLTFLFSASSGIARQGLDDDGFRFGDRLDAERERPFGTINTNLRPNVESTKRRTKYQGYRFEALCYLFAPYIGEDLP